MNFTAAHELGHIILHEQAVLHRDRPFDGSSNIPKDLIEQQADKFAALFLMPANVVKDVFYEIFETEKLTLNEGTALALASGNLRDLKISEVLLC
jgi:Zn-dependent peptidase ImmA (M78 family)